MQNCLVKMNSPAGKPTMHALQDDFCGSISGEDHIYDGMSSGIFSGVRWKVVLIEPTPSTIYGSSYYLHFNLDWQFHFTKHSKEQNADCFKMTRHLCLDTKGLEIIIQRDFREKFLSVGSHPT